MRAALRTLPLVLALAACKSSAPPVAPTPAPTPTPADAAPHDGLFRAGTSWRFAIKIESSHWDDSDPAADSGGNVNAVSTSETTCKVTTTVSFPGGRASEIECDESTDRRVSERVAGVWIQTTDGLWHDTSLPDEGKAPTLDLADRFLPAAPKPESTRHGWCVATSSSGSSSDQLCLDSSGPSSGYTDFTGGSNTTVTFERVE